MNRCPNRDCEHHGIDGCYKNIELVECEAGGLRCLQYTPRITCKGETFRFSAWTLPCRWGNTAALMEQYSNG